MKFASDEDALAASAEPVPDSSELDSVETDSELDSVDVDPSELDSVEVGATVSESDELVSVGACVVTSESFEPAVLVSDDPDVPEDSLCAKAIAPPLPAARAKIAAPVSMTRR